MFSVAQEMTNAQTRDAQIKMNAAIGIPYAIVIQMRVVVTMTLLRPTQCIALVILLKVAVLMTFIQIILTVTVYHQKCAAI